MRNPKAVIQKSGRGRLREAPAVVISLGEILMLWIDGRFWKVVAYERRSHMKIRL